MPNELKPNTSLSKEIPNCPIAWDSTILGLFKECPRKFQLMYLEQWQQKPRPLPLTFGILYHKAFETYDKLRFKQHMAQEEATKETIRFILGEAGEYTTEGDYTTFRQWQTDCTTRNIQNLIRSIIWYLEQYRHDATETVILANGEPAVELSFKIPLPERNAAGESYLLCGHLDRLVDFNSQRWLQDKKTTTYQLNDRYFRKFSPDNQMYLYTLAARLAFEQPIVGVIIDAVQLGVTFCRFNRGFVLCTEEQLNEWYKDALCYMRQAERCALEDYWPMNDKSCHNYGGCPLLGVCSNSPVVRDHYLQADFERKLWDPLEVR